MEAPDYFCFASTGEPASRVSHSTIQPGQVRRKLSGRKITRKKKHDVSMLLTTIETLGETFETLVKTSFGFETKSAALEAAVIVSLRLLSD